MTDTVHTGDDGFKFRVWRLDHDPTFVVGLAAELRVRLDPNAPITLCVMSTQEVAAIVEDTNGCDGVRLRVWPNGANTLAVKPELIRGGKCRTHLDWPEGDWCREKVFDLVLELLVRRALAVAA